MVSSLISEFAGMVAQVLIPTVSGGRIAVRETVIFDFDLKQNLLNCKDDVEMSNLIYQHLHDRGQTFQQQIRELYAEGMVGPEHLMTEGA